MGVWKFVGGIVWEFVKAAASDISRDDSKIGNLIFNHQINQILKKLEEKNHPKAIELKMELEEIKQISSISEKKRRLEELVKKYKKYT